MSEREAPTIADLLVVNHRWAISNCKLHQWVADLQSGMYVNCVYCGYRYGPKGETPTSMADVLKKHIETCPEHPMSKLRALNAKLVKVLYEAYEDVPGWVEEAKAVLAEAREMENG